MANRVQLIWRVPSDELDRFRLYVAEERGEIEGYAGREVERAIREWLDRDEFAAVEDMMDRLVQAAGRTPENLAQKKRSVDHPGGEETSRVRSYVEEDLKEAFARDAGERPGVYLARALRARREGGRSRRVEGKLGRILDDAEVLLSEVDPEGDGIPLTERRAIAICGRLRTQFTREDLDGAIAAVAGDSPPTLRAYRERILDRLDHAPHPANADLFVLEDRARELASETDSPAIDAPAIDRKDYADLSREETGRGLRIALAREATRNDGRYRFDGEDVRRDVLDGYPSEGHSHGLMDLAANVDGFETTRRQGKKWLQVDLRGVTYEEVLSEVPNAGVSIAEGGSRDKNPGFEADKPRDPARILDDLAGATPVRTDGGGP